MRFHHTFLLGRMSDSGEFPFEKIISITEALPHQPAYLLHVRSMGGQSINKMIRPIIAK